MTITEIKRSCGHRVDIWHCWECETKKVKALEIKVKLLEAAISEQSTIVQSDWLSPYEAAGLRGKIAELQAAITELEAENERLREAAPMVSG